jgi:hypothetical protein
MKIDSLRTGEVEISDLLPVILDRLTGITQRDKNEPNEGDTCSSESK